MWMGPGPGKAVVMEKSGNVATCITEAILLRAGTEGQSGDLIDGWLECGLSTPACWGGAGGLVEAQGLREEWCPAHLGPIGDLCSPGP